MGNYYLITFTPLGRFFFGSSQSWGESFYAKSLEFPTQTTILGSLRRTLLKQNNLLDDKLRYPINPVSEDVKKLTGTSPAKGFDENDLNLGIINKLSPVFVTRFEKENIIEAFLPVPLDVFISDSKLKIIQYKKDDNAVFSRDDKYAYKKITEGKTYSARVLGNKQYWDDYMDSKEVNYNSSLDIEKIIKPTSQPGIARENRNKIDKEFYRKKDFMMKEGYVFGVIVEFTDGIDNKLKNDFVFLGGEQSKFEMKITKVEDTVKSYLPKPIEKFFNGYDPIVDDFRSSAEKIVFISHLFSEGKLPCIKHSVMNNMGTIRSLNETGHKTQSFRVIPSGSVFYIDNNFTLKNDFRFASKIGYNYFIEVNRRIK